MTATRSAAYDQRCASERRAFERAQGRAGAPAGVVRVSDIYVGESESLEAALRRFNKRVQADGILTDARRHEYYEKPSERRKKKEAARRHKLRKAVMRQKQRRDF